MTILEKIKFEEDWLSEVNLTKENIRIAFDGIRATALESQQTEKKCTECKWYGTMTCECPLPCTCETKEYWSKATESQPCEDCISRTEALKIMCEKCPMYDCITGCQSYRSIEKMPSVKPQTVTEFADKCKECGKIIGEKYKPCEDAVSRKRLIILVDEGAELHPYKVVGDSETYSNYNQGWADAFDWVYANIDSDNLPSVKPQQGWIPVSERLPEYYSPCLCTIRNHYTYDNHIEVYDHIVVYNPTEKEWLDECSKLAFEVIAWMPLPQPYKESEE